MVDPFGLTQTSASSLHGARPVKRSVELTFALRASWLREVIGGYSGVSVYDVNARRFVQYVRRRTLGSSQAKSDRCLLRSGREYPCHTAVNIYTERFRSSAAFSNAGFRGLF